MMDSSIYRSALRPLLFSLSGDTAHALAKNALRWPAPWRLLASMQHLEVSDPRLRTRYAGLDLPNPIGLAAGFDKNCEMLDSLSSLGFGFVTVGSIMPQPRYGNPFPRIVRLPESQSLADSMGVPSKGRPYSLERLRRFRNRTVPLIANISGFGAEELAAGLFELEPHADAVEISLMCPNVLKPGERFDYLGLLREVLKRIEGRAKPAILRVPNEIAQARDRFSEMIEHCIEAGLQGLKVGGGRPVVEPRLGTKAGTLHGGAIREAALGNVEYAARVARGRISINGNGGVRTAEDVIAMLKAGACCVDLYSAFVYEGWTVARDLNLALLEALGNAPVTSLSPATA